MEELKCFLSYKWTLEIFYNIFCKNLYTLFTRFITASSGIIVYLPIPPLDAAVGRYVPVPTGHCYSGVG